jgi:hypothetical protein
MPIPPVSPITCIAMIPLPWTRNKHARRGLGKSRENHQSDTRQPARTTVMARGKMTDQATATRPKTPRLPGAAGQRPQPIPQLL